MKKIYQITIVLICLSILLVSAFFSDDTLNESDDNTTESDRIADNDSQMGEKYTADIDSQLVLLSDYFNKCLDEYYKYNHFPQNLHFAIVDLNRNGRLELIITDIMGSGHFSITCFYEVSDDYQTLDMMKTAKTSYIPEDIDYSYVDGIGDFLYYEELECFKKDNKYYYLLSNATSAGLGCMFGEAFYSYSFDGMVEKDTIGTYVLFPYNDNTDRIKINFYSKYGGLETEEEYLHFMSSYWYGYEKQPNTSIKWIYLSDNQDIGSAIIESYNGFNTNAVCEKAEDYDYRDIYGNDCEYVTEFVLFRTDTKDFGFLTLVGERNPNPNILVQYNESEFSLGESFVNNYSEYPQAAAWDVDDDGEDEIIISLREYTGNLSTYRLFVCDKEDDIYKKYEFKEFENLINKEISYSYDSNSDIFEFQTPRGKIQFNMPSWSKEYPYDGNVIYNQHFYFDCENMKLIVTPEINMKNSVPFTPIKMTFNILYKEGKFELQYESYEEIEKIRMNSNEESENSLIHDNAKIVGIEEVNGESKITFKYKYGDEVFHGVIYDNIYPKYDLDIHDRVGIKTIDLDGDGIEEIVIKVNAIGNTISDRCGTLHIIKLNENGYEEILKQNTNWETPDGGYIIGLIIQNDCLYYESGWKEATENGTTINSRTYQLIIIDGEIQSIEKNLDIDDAIEW